MQAEKDLVSIIIVNYNTEQLLENCILSIHEHTQNIKYEIIVIDNASVNGSLQELINRFTDVSFHLMNENLGFGAANNVGSSIANGEFLFFLNPDTLLINNAISILYNYMKGHPKVGICGGNMYKKDMSPCSSYYDIDFLLFECKILFNRKRKLGFNSTNIAKEVQVIVGADLFIRKTLFENLAGFDKDFFMYFEEVELCYRTRKNGYKLISVPDAKIIHLQGASAENKSEELGKWSYQEHWYSKFIYFSKTKGRIVTQSIYLLHLLKLQLALYAYSIRKNTEKINYWEQKRNIIKNTFGRYQKYLSNKP